MSIARLPCTLASALFAGLLCGSALRAQNVASLDSTATKPTLLVVEQADGKCEYQLAAGPQHAGEAVFMLLSTSKDPAVALVESPLLEAGMLDAKGNLQGVLAVGASSRPIASSLTAIIVGPSGSPTGVSATGPGSNPQTIQGQPGGGPICLVPPPPPCTGGQLPDLIITNIKFSSTLTSTACTGTPLPRLMCGFNGFDVTVTVKNVGTCAVPCRTDLTVLFGRGPTAGSLTYDFLPVTVQTDDILPGETFKVSRHYFLGPCTGFGTQLQFYGAIVDSAGTIAELSEGNNTGTPVAGCEIL